MSVALGHVRPDLGGEADEKCLRVRELLVASGSDVLVASESPTVSWLLCGRGRSLPDGSLVVLIDEETATVIVPESELRRITQEEHLEELGYRIVRSCWGRSTVEELTRGRRVLEERLESRLAGLRNALQPGECERLRNAGRMSAEALAATFAQLYPDMTEREAAARLTFELATRGMRATAISVAGEVRQLAYTVAPATTARLGRGALLALRAERDGLSVTMTRIVSFVKPTEVLRSRVAIAAEVEARLLAASVPGAFTEAIRAGAAAAFAAYGFKGDDGQACDGGLGGYEHHLQCNAVPADVRLPDSCAVSWRPMLHGGASQDTVLVAPAGPEVVTWLPELPELTTSGLPRPAIVRL